MAMALMSVAAASAILQEPLLQTSDNLATLYAVKQACALAQAWKAALGLADDDPVDYETFVKTNRGSPLELTLRSLLTKHTVFDTRTGTRRPLVTEELSHILSAPAEEVVRGFETEFDVLSLQDAVQDFPVEEMEEAAAAVSLQMAEGLEAGPLQDTLLCILSDGTSADHPLRSLPADMCASADARKRFHPPTYGLLTLYVFEDLLSGALQNGTSLFNVQYSTCLLPLMDESPFRVEDHLKDLPALLRDIYLELLQSEIGF
jgi:hypothetical protein